LAFIFFWIFIFFLGVLVIFLLFYLKVIGLPRVVGKLEEGHVHVPDRSRVNLNAIRHAQPPAALGERREPRTFGIFHRSSLDFGETAVNFFVVPNVSSDKPLLGGTESLKVRKGVNLVTVLLGNS
jgi:hypothetical protein